VALARGHDEITAAACSFASSAVNGRTVGQPTCSMISISSSVR
jgi:hypothetical protein